MYKFHKSLIALYSQFCPTKVPSAHLYSHSILRFHPEVARSDQRSVKYRSSLFLPLLIPLLPFNQHQSIDEKTIRISPKIFLFDLHRSFILIPLVLYTVLANRTSKPNNMLNPTQTFYMRPYHPPAAFVIIALLAIYYILMVFGNYHSIYVPL